MGGGERTHERRQHVRVEMRVIPEPSKGTRRVFVHPPEIAGAFFHGMGNLDFVCGTCGGILCDGLRPEDSIGDLVLKCDWCGSCNEAADSPAGT
jgi:hypothetical protein